MGSVNMSYSRIRYDIICNNMVFIIFIGTWRVYYCIIIG